MLTERLSLRLTSRFFCLNLHTHSLFFTHYLTPWSGYAPSLPSQLYKDRGDSFTLLVSSKHDLSWKRPDGYVLKELAVKYSPPSDTLTADSTSSKPAARLFTFFTFLQLSCSFIIKQNRKTKKNPGNMHCRKTQLCTHDTNTAIGRTRQRCISTYFGQQSRRGEELRSSIRAFNEQHVELLLQLPPRGYQR